MGLLLLLVSVGHAQQNPQRCTVTTQERQFVERAVLLEAVPAAQQLSYLREVLAKHHRIRPSTRDIRGLFSRDHKNRNSVIQSPSMHDYRKITPTILCTNISMLVRS